MQLDCLRFHPQHFQPHCTCTFQKRGQHIPTKLPYTLSGLSRGIFVRASSSYTNVCAVIYQCERDRSRFQQIKSSIESIKSGNQYYPNAHSSAPPLYGNTPVASRTMSTYSQSSATYPAAGYPASGHSNSYRPNSGFSHHASRTGQSPSPWLQHVLTVPGPGVTFKPSPFYEPKALVADVRVCDGE